MPCCSGRSKRRISGRSSIIIPVRFGTLEEAAGAIAFLASDDSGFITAAALPLDGGITEAFTVPE